MIFESPALIAFREDIENRTFSDWVIAHTSFMKPLHTYSGTIRIEENIFMFSGFAKKNEQEFQFRIFRNEVEEIYHGYDDVFAIYETRNLGLGWKPLRITYMQNEKITQMYLIVNYSWGRTDNSIWLEIFKNWVRA
jgi:hypothetical protein